MGKNESSNKTNKVILNILLLVLVILGFYLAAAMVTSSVFAEERAICNSLSTSIEVLNCMDFVNDNVFYKIANVLTGIAFIIVILRTIVQWQKRKNNDRETLEEV